MKLFDGDKWSLVWEEEGERGRRVERGCAAVSPRKE